jgi:low affinity Fe/Cu permease
MQQINKPYVSLRQKVVSLLRWTTLVTVLVASTVMTAVFVAAGDTKSWSLGWQLAGAISLSVDLLGVIIVAACSYPRSFRHDVIHLLRSWLAADDQRLKIK